VDVVGAPEFRAQVLCVLHKMTAGVPELSPDEAMTVAFRRLTRRDLRFMELVSDEDLALLNACLMVEEQCRRESWATLQRLLTLCQFSDGDLSDRLAALPNRAFATAVTDLYALGWIDR
jgi:hypothetical protein